MIGIGVQHALIALGGPFVLFAVLVEQTEVHQRADVRGERRGGPLIEVHGHVVVAVAIVFEGQAEKGAGMVAVGLDGPFVQGDDFQRIAAHGRHGRAALIEIVGRMLDGAEEVIQDLQRFLRFIGVTQGLGAAQRALTRLVAGLLCRQIALDGIQIAAAGVERLGQIKMGHRAAIGLLEDLAGAEVTAEQE